MKPLVEWVRWPGEWRLYVKKKRYVATVELARLASEGG
jgi:hypothetical protein